LCDNLDQEGVRIAAPGLIALAVVIVPEPRGLALDAALIRPILLTLALLIVAQRCASFRILLNGGNCRKTAAGDTAQRRRVPRPGRAAHEWPWGMSRADVVAASGAVE